MLGRGTRREGERVFHVPNQQQDTTSSSLASVGMATFPWARVHIDHAVPFLGKLLLVLVDAFSKRMEVVIMPSTSPRCIMDTLCTMFATHGLPEVLVSDNGSGFTSTEFKDFLKANGIRHITSSPCRTMPNERFKLSKQPCVRALQPSFSYV